MINDKLLTDVVYLMGFEKDRNKIYGDKDIYLMTSKFEGMPNALAEAMCIGVPAISTNCEFGPSDLILNDEMGILLQNDSVEKVVEAIDNMVNNYYSYIKKASNAREILKKKYGYDKILEKWIELIEKK